MVKITLMKLLYIPSSTCGKVSNLGSTFGEELSKIHIRISVLPVLPFGCIEVPHIWTVFIVGLRIMSTVILVGRIIDADRVLAAPIMLGDF